MRLNSFPPNETNNNESEIDTKIGNYVTYGAKQVDNEYIQLNQGESEVYFLQHVLFYLFIIVDETDLHLSFLFS